MCGVNSLFQTFQYKYRHSQFGGRKLEYHSSEILLLANYTTVHAADEVRMLKLCPICFATIVPDWNSSLHRLQITTTNAQYSKVRDMTKVTVCSSHRGKWEDKTSLTKIELKKQTNHFTSYMKMKTFNRIFRLKSNSIFKSSIVMCPMWPTDHILETYFLTFVNFWSGVNKMRFPVSRGKASVVASSVKTMFGWSPCCQNEFNIHKRPNLQRTF